MKNLIPKAAAIIGALLLLGTAGASDAGNIGLGQTLLQLVIGVVLLAGGVLAQEVKKNVRPEAINGERNSRD